MECQRASRTYEAGSYDIWIGEHAEALQPAVRLTVREQAVLERTKPVCPPDAAWEDICAEETVRNEREEWLKRAEREKLPEVVFEPCAVEKNACEGTRKDAGTACQTPGEAEKRNCQEPLADMESVIELIPYLRRARRIMKGSCQL